MSAPGLPDRRSGTNWLVVGGIAIAVSVVVLAFLATVEPQVAVPVLVVDVLLSVGMVIARFTIRPVVRRQWALAACLIVALALTLVAVIVIGSVPR